MGNTPALGAAGTTAAFGPTAPEGSGSHAARASEHWAVSVLRQLPDAVVVVGARPDGSWKVVAVNDAAVEMTGISRARLLHGGPDLLRESGIGSDSREVLSNALATGEPATLTTRMTRDGRPYWAAIELVPLSGDDLRERVWVAVVRDVSEQVESAQLERVRLEIERRARLGLSIVARVSDLLQEADAADVLRAIAEMITRQVVAWSGFFVLERGLQQVEGIAQRPPFISPRPAHVDADADPVLDLLESNEMRTVRIERDAPPAPGTITADLVGLLRPQLDAHPGGDGGILVLPVLGRQRTLGLLVALPHGGPAEATISDALTDEPVAGAVEVLPDEVGTVLELVARRVGMAMDNAQLYAREHLLAETLQRAMLPEQADVRGMDVWTYYSPNIEHAQVGGDWYDVVNLDDETVAVVIGDVVGHDVEAAAAMGQLRSVVRAYAQELVDPATVLGRVDTLVTGMRIPRTASLVYATLSRRDDDGWDLAYSRAGHLPAILVRDGVATTLDEAGGPLIGFGTGDRTTSRVEVLPGDVLVLYTDGLVERRDRGMREGLDALVELCTSVLAPDAAGVGEELLQLADAPEDDVAVVVIRVPGGPTTEDDAASPRRRRWQLPADAASIGRARHAVRRACSAWGIDNVAAAELVVSELMANAVMHGWGRIGLRLQATGDGLRIEVEDGNPAPPITREHHAARVGGFGMHIVDRLADWGWRPTAGGKVVWARLREESMGPVPVSTSADGTT
ncbi:ATP-binding SpoIIE family protein phosphatase [Georgenia subflava]|uniref:SpoIIE family protein phosphatase n=1 Tax=Georgenia subflava TaxID=1622177 RepID=A0A6N7EFL8_9MICO|nr:SpoIIE family protein phosphatase [Georgenia subflava]MPV36830.1 SpoIIE family protein phosphatase [Georgenia subflava]